MAEDDLAENVSTPETEVPKKERRVRKHRERKNRAKSTIVKNATLDRTNNDLKKRFKVKHINYVIDNGIIQNGWLLSSTEAIDEAIQLLQAQNAPVYILGEFASAFIMWSLTRSKTIKGELWIDSNLKDSFDTAGPVDYDMTRQYIVDWCTQAGIK